MTFVTDAIDAVPKSDTVDHGFEMNVTRTAANGFLDDLVGERNDLGITIDIDVHRSIDGVDRLFLVDRAVVRFVDRAVVAADFSFHATSEIVDVGLDLTARADDQFDVLSETEAQGVDEPEIGRIMRDQRDATAGFLERKDEMLSNDVAIDEIGVDASKPRCRREIDELDSELGGDRLGDLLFGGDSLFDQNLAKLLAGGGGGFMGTVDLGLVGDPSFDQYLTKLLACLQNQNSLRCEPCREGTHH